MWLMIVDPSLSFDKCNQQEFCFHMVGSHAVKGVWINSVVQLCGLGQLHGYLAPIRQPA